MKLSLAAVVISDGLGHSQPDIDQPKSGDCSANEPVLKDVLQGRPLRYYACIEPVPPPRKRQ
jgi:hypothetical protein